MCNLHLCYTFCTGVTLFALVLHLNCTALSQSESSNFFMYIISLCNKQNITCPLVDMNFIFSCSTQHLTSERSERARYGVEHEKINFTITAEIHARSLANFYCQYADRHMNLKFTHEFKIHATRQRARASNSTICYRKKQIDVSY